MKKLKLQKVLLAICLALPITLKISNATNAMKQPNQVQSDLPIVQNSNTTGATETINLADTFLNKLIEYIKLKEYTKPFTPIQMEKFLLYYIDNDITKYLTLKLLLNFDQLPPQTTPQGDRYISKTLMWHNLDTLTPELQLKPITTKKGTKVQVSNILNFFEDRNKLGSKYPNPLTTEEKILQKILQFLFKKCMCFNDPQETLQRLERRIDKYKEEYSTVEPKNSNLQKFLSLLSLVADRLDLENYCQHKGDSNSKLAQLAKQLRKFIEIYNTKRIHPQPPPLPKQKVIEFSEGYNKKQIKQQANQLKGQQVLDKIKALIKAYIGDKKTEVDPKTSLSPSYSGPTADHLNSAYVAKEHWVENIIQEQLANHAREFSEGYNKALIKQQQGQQPLNKKPTRNVITRTYTRALQYFLKPKKETKQKYSIGQQYFRRKNKQETVLRVRHYKQFLRDYINGNIATYLSLLIQANYGIITFPANIIRDASEGYYEGDYYNNLHHQLLSDYTPSDSYSFMNTYESRAEIKDILATLRQLRPADPQGLTTTQKILKALFTQEDEWDEDPNEKINLLQTLIEEYNKQPPTQEDDPNNNILLLLGDIAQQLQDEADDQQDPLKEAQLLVLAHKIQSFYSAYKPKQPGTFYQMLKDHVSQNPNRDPLTEQQLTQLLKKYISNDIYKYLALMIQANHKEFEPILDKNDKPLIDAQKLKNLLFENPTQEQRIIDDDEKNAQLLNIIKDLRKINKDYDAPTPVEEILNLLFIRLRDIRPDIITQIQLSDTIEDYTKAGNIPVDKSYSTIITNFHKIATHLLRENDAQFPGRRYTYLAEITKYMNAFRDEYNNKLDQQKREQEEAEKAKREQEEREKREKREKEERAEKIEQLIIKANKDLEQNK